MHITLILSGILGNRTISHRLLESVTRIGYASKAIWLSPDDYRAHRAPPLIRHISTLETSYVARRKVANLAAQSQTDMFIVNGHELAAATSEEFPAARLVVALDATPALVQRLQGEAGDRTLRQTLKYPLFLLQHAQFKRLASRVWRWLPISAYCRDSLIDDYGVLPDACRVMRAPQRDVADVQTTVTARDTDARRLLFVGNDFVRKGGEQLISAVAHLGADYSLTIVSNDRAATRNLPRNAQVVSGITSPEQIVAVYRDHDLLVLPTSYDIYPNVLCESLAQGTPFLATGLPGVLELVDESGAGWSLPQRATAEQIAAAIVYAFGAPDRLADARERAHAYAVRYLTTASLDETLRAITSET